MAKVIKPEPGIDAAISRGMNFEGVPTLKGEVLCPYEYGTPCYWAWTGAYRASLARLDDGK